VIKTDKELDIININDQYVIDSRDLAVMMGKEHNSLMRSIRGYVEVL
jgi:phage regulator Rha-like protein